MINSTKKWDLLFNVLMYPRIQNNVFLSCLVIEKNFHISGWLQHSIVGLLFFRYNINRQLLDMVYFSCVNTQNDYIIDWIDNVMLWQDIFDSNNEILKMMLDMVT